jgi:two-component system response regulator YesN
VNQIKVIVAEDEPIVARYISRIIENNDAYSVVAICDSGEEAIEECCIHHPDILITDIKMSGLSGLELIQAIKHTCGDIRTIIISGFKNFEYAKQAIALGVDNYITKPISTMELEETLERLREEIRYKIEIRKQCELEKTLKNLDYKKFTRLIPYQSFSVLVMYQSGEMHELNNNLLSIPGVEYWKYKNAVFIVDAACLLNKENQLQSSINRYFKFATEGTTRTILLVQSVSATPSILHFFHQLYRVVREYTIPGAERIITFKNSDALVSLKQIDDEEQIKHIERQIHTQDWSGLNNSLKSLIQFWENQNYSIYRIKSVLQRLTDNLQKVGLLANGKTFVDEYFDECIRYADSYQDIGEGITSYIDEILHQGVSSQELYRADIMYKNITSYVIIHLDHNLTLQQISGLFNVSQPYVRKIFRSNTGLSYNEWIQRVKIEHAKKLIQANPNLLIKDVAAKIGYEPLYFSTVFNKAIGISPSEYRFSLKKMNAK